MGGKMAVAEFTLAVTAAKIKPLAAEWSHAGVVSSGDLEVLIKPDPGSGRAVFHVRTKAAGFENVWRQVLERLTQRLELGDVQVHINDNAATPPVVARRIEQAVREGRE